MILYRVGFSDPSLFSWASESLNLSKSQSLSPKNLQSDQCTALHLRERGGGGGEGGGRERGGGERERIGGQCRELNILYERKKSKQLSARSSIVFFFITSCYQLENPPVHTPTV